ncbi:MAG: hypothetical protein PUJ39_02330 [Eubacteriales bacterium]|nr:hypothetical protein [Eubacteriales bacterium]
MDIYKEVTDRIVAEMEKGRCVLCALMQSDFLFQKTNVALASVMMIARS